MAFGGAVHFFGGVMRDFGDILMAIYTLHPEMGAFLKHVLIDVKQTKIAIFIDAAEAPVLVAENAIQFVFGIGQPCHAAK